MSNKDCEQPGDLAIVDALTEVEQDAWLCLHLAELELAAAKRYVIEVTNREGSKRRMRTLLCVVRSSGATNGDSAA